MSNQSYLLERMEKIDRDIEKLERDVVFMNKQIGKKLQKITLLREEYDKVVSEHKENQQKEVESEL